MLSRFIGKREPKNHRDTKGSAFYVTEGDEFNRGRKWLLAIQSYEKAVALDPKLTAIWIQLGHGYRETNQLEAAERAYRKALTLEPANDDAWFFLGVTLRNAKQDAEAFDAFVKAVELNPQGPALSDLTSMSGVSKKDLPEFFKAIDELFDPEDYLKLNGDLRNSSVDPRMHYVTHGWREKRPFSSWFDASYYFERYRKVIGRAPPLLHYWRIGRALKFQASPSDGRLWFEPKAPSMAEWDAIHSARLNNDTRAVVILPVYKGYDETLSAVFHALKSRGRSLYSLLVINDCGPNVALNTELKRLSDMGLFDYVVNDANRGFVQTCNRGIQEFSDGRDVVLLNSDAYVPPGWFDRIIAHADSDDTIATITPLSNNATICSYPITDADNSQALELTPIALDALAAEINFGIHVETPTGVGFCFFMSRKAINQLGALDSVAFKLGYGEENDFSMRALEAGYKNVIATDIFVFHVGSVSFSQTKDANFSAGQKALDTKHPNYTSLTRRHVNADPTRYSRMRLDMARLVNALQKPVIFITHAWGGGIDTYLDAKRKVLDEQGVAYLTVRVKDRSFISIESAYSSYIAVPNLSSLDLRIDFDLFAGLIDRIRPSLIHVNSFAGLDWKHHKEFLALIENSGVAYRYIGHDYSAISRFYHLTRPDNIYRGIPDWDALETWSRMIEHGPEDVGEIAERRRSYEAFLNKAQAVEFPSAAARDTLLRFFALPNTEVVPHDEPFVTGQRAMRRNSDGRIRIASIGAIGVHKGSDLILALARDAATRELPIDYSIIGYSDQDLAMVGAGVKVTGVYASEEEVIAHLDDIQPDLVFIASVWPETFCYTLSIPMAIHLPFLVFDLGAQAERTIGLKWSTRIDPSLINAPVKLSDTIMSLDLDRLWTEARSANDRTN